MSAATFLRLGNIYTKATSNTNTNLRRFTSFFGITPKVCARIWEMIKSSLPAGSKPTHLLWSLNFLKQYNTEHTRRSLFKADEKTLRKWTWVFIELMSNLNVVIVYCTHKKTLKN